MTLLCVCQLPVPDNEPLVPAQRYIMTQRQEVVQRQLRELWFLDKFSKHWGEFAAVMHVDHTTSCFLCTQRMTYQYTMLQQKLFFVRCNLLWCVCANTSRDPCFLNFSHSLCVLSSDPHIVLLLTDARMYSSVCVCVPKKQNQPDVWNYLF